MPERASCAGHIAQDTKSRIVDNAYAAFIVYEFMRITSGNARGISLNSPRGDSTRPATDAARQAIFSSLGSAIIGSKVLDIFAGTGAYGLEAASRGAASVLFVESDRRALEALRINVAAVGKALRSAGETPSMRIAGADCFKLLRGVGEAFDFVFLDPPYAMLEDEKSLDRILEMLCGIASDSATFILEAPAQFGLPREFSAFNSAGGLKKFGFREINRLGKKSKGKPSQIVFGICEIG